MKKVISANYRDRSSPFKWLVRDYDQHPDSAIECKRVFADEVRFETSNEIEQGFGCAIVAISEQIVVEGIKGQELMGTPPAESSIYFDGHWFCPIATHQVTHEVGRLELYENGKMLYYDAPGMGDNTHSFHLLGDKVDARLA